MYANGCADEDTDYKEFQPLVEKYVHALTTSEDRFVSFGSREMRSVIDRNTRKNLTKGKYATDYRGIMFMKDPMDTVIMSQLMWRLKPATIIEIGAFKGGSALWMADLMKSYGVNSKVYSMDIDTRLVDTLAKDSDGIEFIQGDAHKIETAFPPSILEKLPHPWLLSEDAHVNLVGVLEHFTNFMKPGDYMIVEDTCPHTPAFPCDVLNGAEDYRDLDSMKMNELSKFMESHIEDYKVDTYYTDYFGEAFHCKPQDKSLLSRNFSCVSDTKDNSIA